MGDRRKAVKNRCSTGENTLMWVIDKCWLVWEKYFTWFWLTRKRNLLKTQWCGRGHTIAFMAQGREVDRIFHQHGPEVSFGGIWGLTRLL